MFSLYEMKIFMKIKKQIFFLFSCFTASDVTIDVPKQNRNIMTSTLSAFHKEREKQILQQIKIILIPGCSLLSK